MAQLLIQTRAPPQTCTHTCIYSSTWSCSLWCTITAEIGKNDRFELASAFCFFLPWEDSALPNTLGNNLHAATVEAVLIAFQSSKTNINLIFLFSFFEEVQNYWLPSWSVNDWHLSDSFSNAVFGPTVYCQNFNIEIYHQGLRQLTDRQPGKRLSAHIKLHMRACCCLCILLKCSTLAISNNY